MVRQDKVAHLSLERSTSATAAASHPGAGRFGAEASPGAGAAPAAVRSRAASCAAGAAAASCSCALSSPSHSCTADRVHFRINSHIQRCIAVHLWMTFNGLLESQLPPAAHELWSPLHSCTSAADMRSECVYNIMEIDLTVLPKHAALVSSRQAHTAQRPRLCGQVGRRPRPATAAVRCSCTNRTTARTSSCWISCCSAVSITAARRLAREAMTEARGDATAAAAGLGNACSIKQF